MCWHYTICSAHVGALCTVALHKALASQGAFHATVPLQGLLFVEDLKPHPHSNFLTSANEIKPGASQA